MPKAFGTSCTRAKVEVNLLLKRSKPPKSNINKEGKKVLKELREDQDRIVLTDDKGVAMVVVGRKDYLDKVEGLLATLAYKSISTDPTNKFKAQLILKWKPTWRKVCIGPCTQLIENPQVIWVTKNP